MRFDSSFLRRVVPLGVLIALTAGTAWANPGNSSTKENPLAQAIEPSTNSCQRLYNENQYRDAADLCENAIFQLLPQALTLKEDIRNHKKNLEEILQLVDDMFKVTYARTFIYSHFNKSENAFDSARNAIAWGVIYLNINTKCNKKDHFENSNKVSVQMLPQNNGLGSGFGSRNDSNYLITNHRLLLRTRIQERDERPLNTYNPETISIVQKIEELNRAFPGAKASEIKQLQELGVSTP